jgi:hypothetical protein
MPVVDISADFTQTKRIFKYRYSIVTLELYVSAILSISLLDESDQELYRMQKLIIGEEYDAWGADDSYIGVIADIEVRKIVTPIIPEPVV